MDNVRRAYLAGLIDGDGCISINKTRKYTQRNKEAYYQLRLRIAMTTEEPIRTIQEWYPGTLSITMRKGHRKPITEWLLIGSKAASVLADILPYLLLKNKRAIAAIAFWEYHICHKSVGIKGTPEDVMSRREGFYLQLREFNRRGRKYALET